MELELTTTLDATELLATIELDFTALDIAEEVGVALELDLSGALDAVMELEIAEELVATIELALLESDWLEGAKLETVLETAIELELAITTLELVAIKELEAAVDVGVLDSFTALELELGASEALDTRLALARLEVASELGVREELVAIARLDELGFSREELEASLELNPTDTVELAGAALCVEFALELVVRLELIMDEKTSEELAVSFLLDATDELIVEALDSGAALKVAELMAEEIAVLDDVGKGSFPVCLDPPEPPQADRVAHSKLVVTRFIFIGGS